MFAIGFLSLLSVGFVAMAMGGEDDASDIDQTEDMQDELAPSPQGGGTVDPGGNQSLDLSDFGIEVPENIASEDLVRINAFISELEAAPSEEMAGLIQEFIAELEASQEEVVEEEVSEEGEEPEFEDTAEDTNEESAEDEAEDSPTTAEASDDDEDARPPMGDAFRDPLKVAEELEEQRILDEIAAAEARQPENLVTVSDGDGDEIADELVLAERDDDAPATDPLFTVTAPDAPNTIEVGFDSEHTFQIIVNKDTDAVNAGLNSNIVAPEGQLVRSASTTQDENGEIVRTVSWEKQFEDNLDITMNVETGHVGTHISQIDLENPRNSLHFEFGADFDGSVHLAFHESEAEADATTTSVSRAYIVVTSNENTELSSSELATLLASENGQADGNWIIAEIYLGEETLSIADTSTGQSGLEQEIHNLMNGDPAITANVTWASVVDHDDSVIGEDRNNDDSGTTDNEEDDIAELFEDAGLNPGFFGF